MCRLYGFHANEATKVECTLVHAQNALLIQSIADRRGESHADGWGIAAYENGLPTVERRATAAHEGSHFSLTAERIYANTVIAHVRHATVGTPAPANTHPFVYGCWTFAHNGTVTAFDQLRHRLEQETDDGLLKHRIGSTDSESIFYWLLSRIGRSQSGLERCLDGDGLVAVVSESVRHIAQLCAELTSKPPKLNWLITDGNLLVASRWNNSLHWVERKGIYDCEICGIAHVRHNAATDYRATVVASEPISEEPWNELPEKSVLRIDSRFDLKVAPIE